MDGSTRIKRPRYRNWCIILIAITLPLAVFIWVYWQTAEVYHGKPNVTVDYHEQFRRLAEQAAGLGPGTGDGIWTTLRETAWTVAEMRAELEQRITDEGYERRVYWDDGTVDFSYLFYGESLPPDCQREIDLLDRLRAEGVFDTLAEMADGPPGMCPISGTVPMGYDAYQHSGLGQAIRDLARARVASMRVALTRGTHQEIISAFRETLAVARTLSYQPCFTWRLTAPAVQFLAFDELEHELMETDFDADTCRELLEAIGHYELAPYELTAEAERLQFHDIVQRTYTDDGEGDGYWLPWEAVTLLGRAAPMTAQTQAGPNWLEASRSRFAREKRASILKRFDEGVQEILAQKDQRILGPATGGTNFTGMPGDYDIPEDRVALELSILERFMQGAGRDRSRTDAARLMIALELYHALHGAFPESLAALCPDILPTIPLDEEFLAPFGYRLLTDPDCGQSYLLYTYGRDRTDDGGKILESNPWAAWEEHGAGYDLRCILPRQPIPE